MISATSLTSTRGGLDGIWLVPVAGGEERRLSPEGSTAFGARWSPDGERIAFISDAAGGIGKLFVVSATGGEPTLVAPIDNVLSVEWSPDGSTLAFAAPSPGREAAVAVYRIPAAGGSPVVLSGNHAAFNPAWSPDGAMIAYQGFVAGNFEIFVQTADASGLKRLTNRPENDIAPRWSADGSKILFLTNRAGNRDIADIPVEGGPVRMITETAESEGGGDFFGFNLELTPDGSRIVVLTTPTDNMLVTVNVAPLLPQD